MKLLISVFAFASIVLFSCTDRDDNLEGVQIRVYNTTNTTFDEVTIDSLIFSNLKSEDLAFYQKFDGTVLPSQVIVKQDSIETTISVDNILEIDSTSLNLFTYRLKKVTDEAEVEADVLKD